MNKEFDFLTYLINHAEELKQFSKDVNILSSSALTQLQRLPISLRRRAASHKIRRLPFRFRKSAKTVPAKKILRKCRYYIRRRLNLKAVYLKRQLKIKWLYTHIWHAKRFKIVNKWGWRIPYEPAQKTFRPCTKAMTNGCCVVDISYFCTLELFGKANKIINELISVIENGKCESTKSQIEDGKQVSFTMYRPNKWPFNAIGPCKILRVSSEQSDGSSFLLSFHACSRDEVIQTVSEIFILHDIGSNCWTSDSGKVIVRDRSAEFSRFRLIGSRSQNVVHGLLDDDSPLQAVLARPLSAIGLGYAFEAEIEDLKSKRPTLKQTDIIGFASYNNQSVAVPKRQLDELSRFRTNPDLIDAIKSDNKSNLEQLAKFDLDSIIDGEKCPVLVTRIHYRDKMAPGGWEIVVPAKWSMAMWMVLIMRGCRPIGYRYWARYCAIEANSLQAKHDCFPIFGWPDTASGALESESSRDKQLLLWKRRPLSKRINFTQCVTESPFSCPWQRVLSDSADHPFFVIRDVSILFRVVNKIFDGSVKPTVEELIEFLPDACWALVPVILDSYSTVPSSNAVVMAANLDDDKKATMEADKSLIRPVIGYLELADQSLAIGHGRGFGFVSLYQVVHLCRSHRPLTQLVWFKNTNTTRFVAGKLSLSK